MRTVRRLVLLTLALTGCKSSTVGLVPTSAQSGRVTEATFHSAALGVDKRYVVWLPSGYDAGAARYPVIYLLHGFGGTEDDWTRAGGLAATADRMALHAIVVMPDGDRGFYANSVTPADHDRCMQNGPGHREPPERFCVRQGRYEDYIVKDLVTHVDATYRTVAERRARGIGGLSMGGFGALMLAMRHQDLFVSAASHSGVDSLLYAGPHPYVRGRTVVVDDVASWGRNAEPIGHVVRGVFGPDRARWLEHDPASLAAGLKDGQLALYLDCGTEDGFGLHDGAQHLHEILERGGVQHSFHLGPGKHDFDFWRARLGDSLAFHAGQFQKAGL